MPACGQSCRLRFVSMGALRKEQSIHTWSSQFISEHNKYEYTTINTRLNGYLYVRTCVCI